MIAERTIRDIVIEEGFVTAERLNEVLASRTDSTENVGDLLQRMGLITEKQHLQCVALQAGIPFVDLSKLEIEQDVARSISHQLAVKHLAIPIEKTEYAASVAMFNPLDVASIDEIRVQLGVDVDPMFATESDVREAIFRAFGSFDSLSVLAGEFAKGVEISTSDAGAEDDQTTISLNEREDGAPIIRLANALLARAIRGHASDVHVEPGPNDTRVRFRVDGILSEVMTIPKAVQRPFVSRLKVIAGLDIGERRIPQDGRFSVSLSEGSYDLRVSTYPTVHGEKVVLRVLDKSSLAVNLTTLGIPPLSLDRILKRVEESQGLILVTGPTESYSLTIPIGQPALQGFNLYTTTATMQMTPQNAFGWMTSNGIRGTLGSI